MDTFGYLGQGFGVALSPYNLVTALCGTLIGTVVGLLPGLGPINGVALLIPIAFALGLPPETALILLAAVPAFAQDWKADYKTVKFGILSGENEQDRLARWKGFEAHLETTLGVDVEIFTAGNYDGVIQALAADQIEFAYLGSSAYAAAYTASEGGVQPILATESLTGAQFVIRNPNAKTTCGCGSSFSM